MKKIIKLILILTILCQLEVKALFTIDSEIKNVFKTENYNIKLNGNGGTFSKQDKLVISKKHIKLPTPNKKGYKFSHYNNSGNKYDTEIEDVTHINNKELFAKWETENYQIIYDLDGGFIQNEITEYTVEDEFEIPIPTKEKSLFIGWTRNNESTLVINEKVILGTTGDIYFKAHWQEETYNINVTSIIDGINYNTGKEGFTYNVWINDELKETNVYYYESSLPKGTKVRIQTIPQEGIETNYDKTIIVENNYEFKPEWIINEYEAGFCVNAVVVETTKNKFNTKVQVPTINLEKYGFSSLFYYLGGFAPRTTWIQPAHTIYFDTIIEQHNCMVSFGSQQLSNAYYQLDILTQHGIKNCIVNESWNAVECYAKAEQAIYLVDNVWNILPYSGNGYSRYKQVSCDSGYFASYNR